MDGLTENILSIKHLGDGYSIKRIINDANIPYSIIIDSAGNEWYFCPTDQEEELLDWWANTRN